jgi:hypothetical protein
MNISGGENRVKSRTEFRRRIGRKYAPGSLAEQIMFPTPTARDYKSGAFTPTAKAKRDEHSRGKPLSEMVGGQLNPKWVEWLMGYEVGWTDLNHSETP